MKDVCHVSFGKKHSLQIHSMQGEHLPNPFIGNPLTFSDLLPVQVVGLRAFLSFTASSCASCEACCRLMRCKEGTDHVPDNFLLA